MRKKLSITELSAPLIHAIEGGTNLRCYDTVPKNAEPPFYILELAGTTPEDSKTMYKTRYSYYLHAVTPETGSNVPAFDLIQKAEETLTDNYFLPEPYNLISLDNNGVNAVYTDETGETRAVLSLDAVVSYGFKSKI